MVSHPVCWNIYFATNVQQELCPTTKIPLFPDIKYLETLDVYNNSV